MNNKTLKKLIVIGTFAMFIVGFNNASAYDNGYRVSVTELNSPAIVTNYSYPNSTQNNYAQEQPFTYVQQPTNYVQQPVNYVQQPVYTNNVEYVPQNYQTVKTTTVTKAPVVTQKAVRNVTTTSVNQVNSSAVKSSGDFVSYDAYNTNPNMMVASAYGYNNGMPLNRQAVVYDGNDVTALSVAGSNSFMPSSVFQWFLVILLILAIVIIARKISKSYAENSDTVPAHH